jgi:hypothetical protein
MRSISRATNVHMCTIQQPIAPRKWFRNGTICWARFCWRFRRATANSYRCRDGTGSQAYSYRAMPWNCAKALPPPAFTSHRGDVKRGCPMTRGAQESAQQNDTCDRCGQTADGNGRSRIRLGCSDSVQPKFGRHRPALPWKRARRGVSMIPRPDPVETAAWIEWRASTIPWRFRRATAYTIGRSTTSSNSVEGFRVPRSGQGTAA